MKMQNQLTDIGTTQNRMDHFAKCLTDAGAEMMWGLPKQHVINVFYPNHIPNSELYRRCQTDPISSMAHEGQMEVIQSCPPFAHQHPSQHVQDSISVGLSMLPPHTRTPGPQVLLHYTQLAGNTNYSTWLLRLRGYVDGLEQIYVHSNVHS